MYRSDHATFHSKDEAWRGVLSWLRSENVFPVYRDTAPFDIANLISALLREAVSTNGWTGIEIEPEGEGVRIRGKSPHGYEHSRALTRTPRLAADIKQFFEQ